MFRDGLNRQEVEGIRIILRLVCREFSIVLSDASLSNLVIHVFIALTRYRFTTSSRPTRPSRRNTGTRWSTPRPSG